MPLEDFEFKFFEHLKAEFESGFSDDQSAQANLARTIIQNYRTDPDALTASDIYALEILILDLQPTERLLQRAPALRLKYRELVGDMTFATYRPADPPAIDKLEDPAAKRPLLTDLQQLLHFLHWSYLFSPLREAVRTRLIKIAVILIIFYSLLWGALLGWFHHEGQPFLAMSFTVLYCGLIGGFISSQRRLQMVPTTGDPLSSLYDLKNGQYFLWFAPLTGAIFAAVLMALFIGGVMQGIIFPEFAKDLSPSAGGDSWPFMTKLLPVSGKDYALLFLWSFIAGFAERLVPDAVDRLTNRAQEAQKPHTPTVPGPGAAAGATTGRSTDGDSDGDSDDTEEDAGTDAKGMVAPQPDAKNGTAPPVEDKKPAGDAAPKPDQPPTKESDAGPKEDEAALKKDEAAPKQDEAAPKKDEATPKQEEAAPKKEN